MANQIETLNGIAVTSIEAVNGLADAAIEKINGLEFTGVLPDAHTLIATATASSSATLEFTSGIDSTYNEYQWHFVNMHPATNAANFQFQVNAAGASGFNETMTTTTFMALHNESDAYAYLAYRDYQDQANGTAYQTLAESCGNGGDMGTSGVLTLYEPSSTTYVKHFTWRGSYVFDGPRADDYYAAGYINVTSAIDEISFKFSSGNIDAGVIKMYGVAKS